MRGEVDVVNFPEHYHQIYLMKLAASYSLYSDLYHHISPRVQKPLCFRYRPLTRDDRYANHPHCGTVIAVEHFLSMISG